MDSQTKQKNLKKKTEIKNIPEEINSRLDNTEEWIRELEEKVREITQADQKHILRMRTV